MLAHEGQSLVILSTLYFTFTSTQNSESEAWHFAIA